MDKNNLVGKSDGRFGLAWHYPEDLKFYKENTINKINIMGRNTYEAIGQALPNRQTYILSRNENYKVNDADVVNSVEEVLQMSKTNEVMICGGVSVYECFNQYAKKIIISRIDADHDGDVYFDTLDLSKFTIKHSKRDGIIDFQTWERNED